MILAEKGYSSYGLNTLGPLCLWQCFQLFLNFSQHGHQMALLVLVVELANSWGYLN